MSGKKPVKVLVVDDSALVRETLTSVLSSDPGIVVTGSASDPYIAVEKIALQMPDVITLDIEMPRMDGITFLRNLMSQHPVAVVVCSSLGERGAETTLRALELGAVDVILKPRLGAKKFLEESRIRLVDAVKAASFARVRRISSSAPPVEPKLTADAVLVKRRMAGQAMAQTTEKVVVVGASTGGTEALRVFLESLPYDFPGTVIVQHMPEKFTSAFARRLDQFARVTVKEAVNGDAVFTGQVLIAPGNRHTLLKRSGSRYFVEVKDGPLVSRHRPSVDVLFRSAAMYAGNNAVGVIMTGMGDDGAKGLLEMRELGAFTVAQDEESCVVYGMPREAVKIGAVEKVLPLESIGPVVTTWVRNHAPTSQH
jgi:two-component system chemotaxis response regulator CheB